MKKALALVVAGLIVAASLYAGPQAVLSGLKGKVEIKPAQGDWIPASEGMKVDIRATLSTGFDSTATLTIEKSRIVVKPLTRLTIDKLVEQSAGSVAASMFLRVGAVQASVKATIPGTPQDFKVKSPYSTASVRGTEFSFDGLHLAVIEGVVRLIPGRPVRDTQPSEGGDNGNGSGEVAGGGEGAGGGNGGGAPSGDSGDSGFAGAVAVGDANPNAGVDVGQNQVGTIVIKRTLDTGAPPAAGNSPSGAGGGAGQGAGGGGGGHQGKARSGVIITITDVR